MVDLTITIASFNSRDVIRQALKSIYKHTQGLSFEIIVVDNASSDGSADMIREEFPFVQLIQSPRNLGFGAAHNLAIQQAQGKEILVLNSDVLFIDNAAKQMIDTLQRWPNKVGVLGPRILNRDGSYAPSASCRQFSSRLLVGISLVNVFFPFIHYVPLDFLRNKLGFVLGKIHGKFFQPSSIQEVEWVDGICVLFSRGALEEAGLFDEQYFFDMEIGDLEYRIREKGWGVIFDTETAIVHLGGYSRQLNPEILRYSIKSVLIYYAKFRPGYVPFLKFLLMLLLLIKIQYVKLIKKSNDDIQLCQLYRQMLTDVMAFTVNDAHVNQVIPQLLQTSFP